MTKFCDVCDVAEGLHYGEDDCYGAGLRADLVSRFWSLSPSRGGIGDAGAHDDTRSEARQ